MVHLPARTPARTLRLARRATVALLVAAAVVGGLPPQARADHHPTGNGADHNPTGNGNADRYVTGNGKFNKNVLSVRSPEFARGIQHTSNEDIGGITTNQNLFCKGRFRHCRLVQRANAVDP